MTFALSKRALGWSALVFAVAGAVTFGGVLGYTGGTLYRNDGAAYFLYAASVGADFDFDISDEYAALEARYPDPEAVEMLALRDSVERVPGSGRVVLPWPPGMGVLMAPFYGLGYGLERLAAVLGGRPPDPFGLLPQLVYALGVVAYAFLGFWATVLLCRNLAPPAPALLAVAAIALAGPLVFYVYIHPTMSHGPSFGLVALLLLFWWRRWEGQEGPPLAVLGLLLGLLVVVRYQHVVFGLLLVALVLRELRQRPRRPALIAAAQGLLASLLPLALHLFHQWWIDARSAAPDLLQTGDELALGRNAMDLRSPHFFDVLLSCQHGAFYWAPLLGIGFLGLLWAARRAGWARLFVLIVLVHAYLVGSLQGLEDTNWSGAFAFGMRYLTECAPLFATGLAFLLDRAAPRLRRGLYALMALLVVANGLLILAYGANTIPRNACVTHQQMAVGIATALGKVAGKVGGAH